MALRKRWKWVLLSLLIVLLLVVTLGLPYAMAHLLTRAGTRPMDRALTSTPADFGVDYRNVTFESPDGVLLSGWFMEGEHPDVVVAVGHGLFRSRREVLDRAVFFRRQGFDTLVFDLRRHGESRGERITLGYKERFDFLGAVAFLRARRPGARAVLYGVSMGAAAALLAARESEAVAAVVADSPFSSFERTIVHHVNMIFGLPRFPFASALMFFLEVRGGFEREDFDLERAIAELGERPVLIIAGGDDRRMPVDVQKALYEAATDEASDFVVFDGAGHGRAYELATEDYEAVLVRFLERTVGTGP